MTSAVSCLPLAFSSLSLTVREQPSSTLAEGWAMELSSFQPGLQRAAPGSGAQPLPLQTPQESALRCPDTNLAQRFTCLELELEPTHPGPADPASRISLELKSPRPWRGGGIISADDLTAYLTEKTKALGGEAGPPVPTRCLPSLEAGHARASLAVTQGPFPTTTPSPSTLSGSFYGNIPIITQRETVRKTPS